MLMSINTPTFLAEAAVVASVVPCWHSKRRTGYVRALAGRDAS
jgi:hypothetical protein